MEENTIDMEENITIKDITNMEENITEDTLD
jgi:hypothetical protein